MCGFHHVRGGKKHTGLYVCDTLLQNNGFVLFLKHCDGHWKVDKLQQFEIQEIVGSAKWITIKCIEIWSSCKESDAVYMVELERSPVW